MTRRPRRTLPALLVALAVLGVAAAAVTSAVQTVLGRTPLVSLDAVTSTLGGVAWRSPVVLVVAGVAAAAGLVLLLAAVLPGPGHVLPLAAGPVSGPGSGAGWHRNDLAARLRRRVRTVEGVVTARATVRSRRIRVVARTRRGSTDELRPSVAALVSADLDTLDLARRPRVQVRVSSTRKEG